jgi:hypothetical protein
MGEAWFNEIKGDFGITGTEVDMSVNMAATANAGNESAGLACDASLSTGWTAPLGRVPHVTIDLGSTRQISRIMTQFGFPKAGYYYTISTSEDGLAWEAFADRSSTASVDSVYADVAATPVSARYVRIKVNGAVVEKPGAEVTIWDISVF